MAESCYGDILKLKDFIRRNFVSLADMKRTERYALCAMCNHSLKMELCMCMCINPANCI